MRRAAAALVVLVLAGCGGTATKASTGGSIPESARFAPRGSDTFLTFDTSFSDDQWTMLERLGERFPGRVPVTAAARALLRREGGFEWADARGAVGAELAVASFGRDEAVDKGLAVTRPRDESAFDALLRALGARVAPTRVVSRSVDGWTLVSDREASLDAGERAHAGRALADAEDFRRAFTELPDDALLRYFSRPSLAEKATGTDGMTAMSLRALVDGLQLQVIETRPGGRNHRPTLASVVPGDALAFVSFGDHDSGKALLGGTWWTSLLLIGTSDLTTGLSAAFLTGDLDPYLALASVVSGEGAVYLRRGSPLPETTLVLTEPDPQAALAKLDKAARQEAARAGSRVEVVEVDGVAAKRLTVKRVPVYYAVLDGRLVVTDSQAGIAGLKDDGPRLADDARYRAALRSVDAPPEVGWLAFVDVHDLAPLLTEAAALTGHALPAEVAANLEPVRSLAAFGRREDGENRVTALLRVR